MLEAMSKEPCAEADWELTQCVSALPFFAMFQDRATMLAAARMCSCRQYTRGEVVWVQDALEEVEDLIACACQLHIRFRQVRDSVPF